MMRYFLWCKTTTEYEASLATWSFSIETNSAYLCILWDHLNWDEYSYFNIPKIVLTWPRFSQVLSYEKYKELPGALWLPQKYSKVIKHWKHKLIPYHYSNYTHKSVFSNTQSNRCQDC